MVNADNSLARLPFMLEGQVAHLPAPKLHFAQNTVFKKDMPTFCMTKHPLVNVKGEIIDKHETEMMCVPWTCLY